MISDAVTDDGILPSSARDHDSMSAALLNAILVVAFLTMYVLAGEVLIGTRRHHRRRRDEGHAISDPHWTRSAEETLRVSTDRNSEAAA